MNVNDLIINGVCNKATFAVTDTSQTVASNAEGTADSARAMLCFYNSRDSAEDVLLEVCTDDQPEESVYCACVPPGDTFYLKVSAKRATVRAVCPTGGTATLHVTETK